jgi:GntR family transcriptional regulator
MTGLQPGGTPEPGLAALLNRDSLVPLYYQLQEILKEKIESAVWEPGDSLPSEPELAASFGVSRVVVRQALAILEDDRQVIRVRGKGTLVTPPKLGYQIGGLSRMLLVPRDGELDIELMDCRVIEVEPGMRQWLAAAEDEDVLRITSMLLLRRRPLVISYSYFRAARARQLAELAASARSVPAHRTLAEVGVTLTRSEVIVETSQCGQVEADRFGIDHRSPVFLGRCREFESTEAGEVPFEVARVECRGDIVRLRFDMAAPQLTDALPRREPHPSGHGEYAW